MEALRRIPCPVSEARRRWDGSFKHQPRRRHPAPSMIKPSKHCGVSCKAGASSPLVFFTRVVDWGPCPSRSLVRRRRLLTTCHSRRPSFNLDAALSEDTCVCMYPHSMLSPSGLSLAEDSPVLYPRSEWYLLSILWLTLSRLTPSTLPCGMITSV